MGRECFILPDFIIIGANKAGTTSIANYLNISEKIGMSKVKEPMFFSSIYVKRSIDKSSATLGDPYFALNLKEYSSLYEDYNKDEVQMYGEASTSYLANPKVSAPMIRSIVPNVKIIAILREPVDRAISAYKMTIGNGIEKRSMSEIIEDFYKDNPSCKIYNTQGVKNYIENGFYYQLLKIYYEYFSKENILLLKYDDLKKNPEAFMGKIFKFLNIEPFQIDFSKKYNTQDRHLKGKEIIITDEDRCKLSKIFFKEMENLMEYIDVSDWISQYKIALGNYGNV